MVGQCRRPTYLFVGRCLDPPTWRIYGLGSFLESVGRILSQFGEAHMSTDVGWGCLTPLVVGLPPILSQFGAPRFTFAWVQSLVTFGVHFLWLVGPWIHGRGHMDTIFTLDEPSLNQHLGCLQSVFLVRGTDW